jgi:hypothetical protein
MHANPFDWLAITGGIGIMLYAFMADALNALPANTLTLHTLRPAHFNWPVFLIGLGQAAIVVWRMAKSRHGKVT